MMRELSKLLPMALLLSALVPRANGDIVTIRPSQDATIFENNLGNSLGGGQALFVGTNAQTSPRRALVEFDIAGALPAGATIEGVQLRLTYGAFAGNNGAAVLPIALHRITSSWGEGTVGTGTGLTGTGQGFAGQPGDATWSSRFLGTDLWTSAGSDSVPAASATQMVGAPAVDVPFTWGSTPQMIADIQTWLDNPAVNHGWLLRGSETVTQSGRIFYSREATNPDFAPQLTVTFTPVPEPSALLLASIAMLGFGLLRWTRRSFAPSSSE